MATILALKRRIKAAQNVSKTTRAMQMIAASKLKKAQDAAISARPYVEKLSRLTKQVAGSLDESTTHPYLQSHNLSGKSLVIIIAPDKGLCGGLVTNLLREFLQVAKTEQQASYVIIGKKLETQVHHIGKEVIASFICGTSTPTFDMVYPIARIIDEYFLGRKVDSVKILATHFTSIFTQTPKITTILPISLEQDEQKQTVNGKSEFLFEPNPKTILPILLQHYLEMTLYQQLLESFVSEQASRMIAMQNATSNAKDIIQDLQLEYNKTRQAKITSELLDITGGRRQNAEQ